MPGKKSQPPPPPRLRVRSSFRQVCPSNNLKVGEIDLVPFEERCSYFRCEGQVMLSTLILLLLKLLALNFILLNTELPFPTSLKVFTFAE
jgi:hypothetical protein